MDLLSVSEDEIVVVSNDLHAVLMVALLANGDGSDVPATV